MTDRPAQPMMDSFVGRERELSEMDRLLNARRSPGVVLIGRGGIGKTSLARAYAQAAQHSFDEIRFYDGYEGGASDRFLEPRPGRSILYIADGLERLATRDYNEVVATIEQRLRGNDQSKAIFVSRISFPPLGHFPTVEVSDLDRTSFDRLLIGLIRQAPDFNPTHVNELYSVLNGHPLATILAVRHFAAGSAKTIAGLIATLRTFSFDELFGKLLPAAAPHFSLLAIVRPEGRVKDGQLISFVKPAYERLLLELGRNPNSMYEIDPRKWEEIIAAAYDKAGFDEVILTPRSGDLGRDVIAIKKGFGSVKIIEQVKAYNRRHLVKADEVRALLGVLAAEPDATKAIFTTTSSFAPGIRSDRLLEPFMPYRLELIDGNALIHRLIRGN